MRLQDEVSYLYSPMRRNQSAMGSQGLIELSTISHGCTLLLEGWVFFYLYSSLDL